MSAARPNPAAAGSQDPVAALLRRTRTDRGMPDRITDPRVLARVAAIVRTGSSDAR